MAFHRGGLRVSTKLRHYRRWKDLASTSLDLSSGATPKSYTVVVMPSKHPRIAVTADPDLGQALARVRAATGTHEGDATLVRRLAVAGAQVELEAGRGRREAIEALFAAMDRDGFDLDLEEIDRLNSPPRSV
jgi:hypothetical protein